MKLSVRLILGAAMLAAFCFGFLHHLEAMGDKDFQRLHVFLFNLVSGGALLMIHTLGERAFSAKSSLYLVLAAAFGAAAFFEIYPAAILLAFGLGYLVEKIRRSRFPLFPFDFFSPGVPVSEKFHHAAVLCLSIGLFFSGAAMMNAKWFQFFPYPKLTLDLFFLGFSFPLSLLGFSLMFANLRPAPETMGLPMFPALQNLAFWTLNLGVITFFCFILLGAVWAEFAVSTVLYSAILLVFYLHTRLAVRGQQMALFTSGLCFLLLTALTGLLYIFLVFFGLHAKWQGTGRFLMLLHTFLSLYGWNLSGLAVLFRRTDFPLAAPARHLIALQWIAMAALAPLGHYIGFFAVLAAAAYAVFLAAVLFAPGTLPEAVDASGGESARPLEETPVGEGPVTQ
jgi:hypothetical protein